MNTPIIKISDDQNTITHESGVVTVFTSKIKSCEKCCYLDFDVCMLIQCSPRLRKDKRNGIFKLKQP